MPSAKAADLGGDCCADLEERVAELEATAARKGNRRVSLTISGQVTRGIMWADDGKDTGFFPGVDGSFATTGFTFTGSAKINPNWTAGFLIAIDINSQGRSHQIGQGDDEGMGTALTLGSAGFGLAGDSPINLSQATWWLQSTQLGRITVGRQTMAAGGVSTVDLGGIGVAASSAMSLNAGAGFVARTPSGLAGSFNGPGTVYQGIASPTVAGISDKFLLAQAGNTVFATYGNFLGSLDVGIASLSRKEGLRYDSPVVGGFTFSASIGEGNIAEGNYWDVALRYAGEMGGFRIAGAVGYINERDCEGAVCSADGTLNAASGSLGLLTNNADKRIDTADRRKVAHRAASFTSRAACS